MTFKGGVILTGKMGDYVADNLNRVQPSQMNNIELMEVYSCKNQMVYKSEAEQNYTAELRQEIMKRMEGYNK